MSWTQFNDMHSGGGRKEKPYEHIYIEAPEAEARIVFYNRFGHSPDRVTCTCCGEDYSVTESPSFAQASGFARGCSAIDTPRDPETGLFKRPDRWFKAHYWLEPGEHAEAERRGWTVGRSWALGGKYRTVEEYRADPSVLVICSGEIAAPERVGSIPEEGYVWVG